MNRMVILNTSLQAWHHLTPMMICVSKEYVKLKHGMTFDTRVYAIAAT